jgi:hypothetical protein
MFPPVSVTLAVMVDDPPVCETSDGFAEATIPPTAADPTAILRALAAGTLDPPDVAVIVAIPEDPLALNVLTALPLTSV